MTEEQLQYVRSVAVRKVQDALRLDFEEWDRELRRSTWDSFVKLSVDFKGTWHPIRYYREKELETTIVCDNCTLEYAVYGVFAHCPDCGTHNSLQILKKNLELAEKEVSLADSVEDPVLASYLVNDALENVVSAFDGFGRQVCRLHSDNSSDAQRAMSVSFQNLPRARDIVRDLYVFDLAGNLEPSDWSFCVRSVQKRHLLSHAMGVIDQQYVDITHDQNAVVGRMVTIDSDEVSRFIELVTQVASDFFCHFSGSPSV
jgi:hypothetical protein